MNHDQARCAHIKSNGSRCKSWALQGDDRCWAHSEDPDIIKRRAEARVNGGRHRKVAPATELTVSSLEDVVRVLNEALSMVDATDGVSGARAIGYLCGVMIKALQAHDLEERISKLEEAIGGKYH